MTPIDADDRTGEDTPVEDLDTPEQTEPTGDELADGEADQDLDGDTAEQARAEAGGEYSDEPPF